MNIIRSTARDVGTPGVDQYTGYGIIDARAALKASSDYALLAGIHRLEVVQKGGQPGRAGAWHGRRQRLQNGAY